MTEDKALTRHEETLVTLLIRLQQKTIGEKIFYSPHNEYGHRLDGSVTGEMDLYVCNKRNNKWHRRYYEVKGRDSDVALQRAKQQFANHYRHHKDDSFKYIYVTPTRVERIRINEVKKYL